MSIIGENIVQIDFVLAHTHTHTCADHTVTLPHAVCGDGLIECKVIHALQKVFKRGGARG